MASVAGIGSMREEDRILIGSGIAVSSGSCMSGCGSSFSIPIISWKECDTLGKKIGFVFTKSITLMCSFVSKTYRLLAKTIKILHIDKLFEIFYKIIKGISKKLFYLSISILKKCIKLAFDNKLTSKIADITKKVSKKIYDFLIYPFKIIRKIFRTNLNASYKESIVNSTEDTRVKQDSKISKIFKKFLNFIESILVPINNWTFVPLYNRVIFPALKFISDIFLGAVGGISQKEKKTEEEEIIKT